MQVRNVVKSMAEAMEKRLANHDATHEDTDWTQMTEAQIEERIKANLRQALDPKFENDEVAKRSCDDIANFAMFLKHKIEGRKVPNRGR